MNGIWKKHWGERNFETNRTYHPLWSLHVSLFQSAQCSAPIHCLLCTTSHQAALVALSLSKHHRFTKTHVMDAFRCWIFINLSNTNDMSSAPKIIHVQNELCPDVQYYIYERDQICDTSNPWALLFFWVKLSETLLHVIYETLIRQCLLKCPPKSVLQKWVNAKGNFRTLLNFWDTRVHVFHSQMIVTPKSQFHHRFWASRTRPLAVSRWLRWSALANANKPCKPPTLGSDSS